MLPFNQLSYWEKETYINHINFLIVGSGIVGLTTAIYLKQRFPKQKVVVIERGYLPTGASSKNAGFACIGSPSELLDDLKHNSEDEVFSTVEKRWKGLLTLKDLLGKNQIGFVKNGSYELFNDESTFNYCVSNMVKLNKKLKEITSISSVFNIDKQIISKSGFKGFKYAISHQAEGQIDTGKMIYSLIKLAIEKDVIFLNQVEAKTYSNQTLYTNLGELKYDKLLICTNGFAKQMVDEDITPARAQVLITYPIHNLKFKGIFHFDSGYYYFRNVGQRVLFGGGRNIDFKTETTTKFETNVKIINQLKKILSQQLLPDIPFEIEHEWTGIMGVGKKKSPIVKQIDKNVYCGVRLGGMGVAIGSLVGKELADKI